jgi:GH15 family glucan-1,4-alpha-glucosidase
MDWLTARFRDAGRRRRAAPDHVRHRRSDEPPEEELGHLEGYRGSGPVRIGNGAADQLQLDIYGELIDSIYLYNKYGEPISHDAWDGVARVIDWLSDNWDQADEGSGRRARPAATSRTRA